MINTDLSRRQEWRAVKGFDNQFTLIFLQSGVAFDVSIYTFQVNIRKIGDSTNIVELTQGDGITNGGASGIVTILLDETTSDIIAKGYFYEIVYTNVSFTNRLLQGTFNLVDDYNTDNTSTSLTLNVDLNGTDVRLNVTLGGGGGDQTLSEVLTEGNDGGGLQIKNIADPTAAQDAATKNYVDNQVIVVPDATPSVKGIAKLYSDLSASNTDGSVTQAGIKTVTDANATAAANAQSTADSKWTAVDASESVKGIAQIENQAGAEDAAANGTVPSINNSKILSPRGWRYAFNKAKTLVQTITAKWTFNDVALINQIQSGKKVGIYIDTDGTLTKVSNAEYNSTDKKWTFTGKDSSSSSFVVEWLNSNLDLIFKLSNGKFGQFGGTTAFLEVVSGIANDNAGVKILIGQSKAWKIIDGDSYEYIVLDSSSKAVQLKQQIEEIQTAYTTTTKHGVVVTTTTASAQNTILQIPVATDTLLDLQLTMSAYATDGSVVKGYAQSITKNAGGTISGDSDVTTDLRLPGSLNGSWNVEHDNTNKRVNVRFQNESGTGKTYTCFVRAVYTKMNLPT